MNRRNLLLSAAALALAGCTSRLNSGLRPVLFGGRAAAFERLVPRLNAGGFKFGRGVHLMAFKESHEFEVWLEQANGRYAKFATYPICAYSGTLGPKLREGDGQTPEGYYEIQARNMHPDSGYHLALDLGFPNAYDRALGRTGSLIRIHGGCASIGCYAIGNWAVEEVYLLAEQAFLQGERRVTFAGYPFRPTATRLDAERGHEWAGFWRNIAQSYTLFMAARRPPFVDFVPGTYFFSPI